MSELPSLRGRIDPVLKLQQRFYRHIVSQLLADGHDDAAKVLKEQLGISGAIPDATLFAIFQQHHQLQNRVGASNKDGAGTSSQTRDNQGGVDERDSNDGQLGNISAEDGAEATISSPNSPPSALTATLEEAARSKLLLNPNIELSAVKTRYKKVSTAAQPSRATCACFSGDGSMAAVGCADGSVRVYDVDAALDTTALISSTGVARSAPAGRDAAQALWVIPHDSVVGPVTAVALSGSLSLLAVGTQSGRLVLYNITNDGSAPKLKASLVDMYRIVSLQFHPLEAYLLVASTHPDIRLYNTSTSACYTAMTASPHCAPLADARYCHGAALFATCDLAGCVKIWATVSTTCVHEFEDIFDGAACASVRFSQCNDFLLVGSMQEHAALLSATDGTVLSRYNMKLGATSVCPVVFGVDENTVLGYAGFDGEMKVWHTSSGATVTSFTAHPHALSRIEVHRRRRALITLGKDNSAAFWHLQLDKDDRELFEALQKKKQLEEQRERRKKQQQQQQQKEAEAKEEAAVDEVEEAADDSEAKSMDTGGDGAKETSDATKAPSSADNEDGDVSIGTQEEQATTDEAEGADATNHDAEDEAAEDVAPNADAAMDETPDS